MVENRIFVTSKNFTVEVDEGNHEDYDTEDEEERKEMFNKHNMDNFHCNPNHPTLIFTNFWVK